MSPSEPTPPARPSRRLGVLLALLVLAIFASYANSLHAPFVYDDMPAIPDNPTIRALWPLTAILQPPEQGGLTISGRPVLNLSLALNYAISGTRVWSYHVFNLLVHTGSALLLCGIVHRTLIRDGPWNLQPTSSSPTAMHLGVAVAALWALHPLLTQAVTYTVQRAESLMGFFYLLTLYAFIRGVEPPPEPNGGEHRHRRWFGVSIAACFLGMGTKEVMATAPLLVMLYDRTFVGGSLFTAWRQRRVFYLALAATWLALGALVLSTGGNRGGTIGLGVGVPIWAYPLTQFEAVARYLALSVWPHPLIFEYGTSWVRQASDVASYAALVLPLMVGTLVALRRRPALGFCGAWFFLILAPTSLAPGTIQMTVEHRMYLPLAAVVAVSVVLTYRCCGRRAWWGLGLAGLVLGWLTHKRNDDYRSHLGLWSDTVRKRPDNPRAHASLAEAWDELGRTDEALRHRAEAVRLLPDEAAYRYNLASTLAETGRLPEAAEHYRASVQLLPDEARTHNNLAVVLGRMGDDAGALAHYAATVRLKPDDPLYRYNYGIALMRAGHPAEAAASYEAALRLQPGYSDAHYNLGTALVRLNRADEALAHYTSAVRRKPEDPEYRLGLGEALLLAQRPAEAWAEFRTSLAATPDSAAALLGAGNALAALGRNDEAIASYQAGLRRAPNDANAHVKLGNVLFRLNRVPEALGHYEAAVRLSPADAEAHYNLGVAHARLEQWERARTAFEAALSLRPDNLEAQQSLEKVRRLLQQ